MSEAKPVPIRRNFTIFGAVAVGVGLVGFLIGISEPVEPVSRMTVERPHVPTTVRFAPSYYVIEATANFDWKSDFSMLKQNSPGLFDPVHRTAEMKNDALIDRLRTRAFDGAPPVVPHPIQQQTYSNCLVCHAEGMKLGDRIASKVSHPHYASCTQCHVEAVTDFPFAESFIAQEIPDNKFEGKLRAGAGDRLSPGAPPTIPHTMQMRSDCMSCHGLVARPGLRTTHPWLKNCVQCHASSAAQDWHPGFALGVSAMTPQLSASASPESASSSGQPGAQQ